MAANNLDQAPVADRALGMEIPVIDLARGDAAVVRQVRAACLEWGFFQIVGHGLPVELVAHAAGETKALFAADKI